MTSAATRIATTVQYAVAGTQVPATQLPAAARVRRWVRRVLTRQGRGGQLTVRIVGAAEGAALNQRYRRRKGATNVLSFPYGQGESLMTPLLGDIVICAPVVVREAAAQHKPGDAHWAHLVVHGVLHLLGYDHEEPRQARVMESLETALLGELGFPDPYRDAPDGKTAASRRIRKVTETPT